MLQIKKGNTQSNSSKTAETIANNNVNYHQLAAKIKAWGKALGFSQVGISDIDLSRHEAPLRQWLAKGYHGEMDYMQRHITKRTNPAELFTGTLKVICVRMDYLPTEAGFAKALKNKTTAYISRYALGRDYHKVLRQRLKKLGEKITQVTQVNCRPFVDSAPVMERQLAENAGLGWTGKHSLLLNQTAGSWFFLGELFVDLPLPIDSAVAEKCQSCVACIKICPTGAIVEPYVVDARRCISYLTIELKGSIPEQYRTLIGNRIYGCDDCQLICPWNRFAPTSQEPDFTPRTKLTDQHLLTLFSWDEHTFLTLTAGSAIRRIGHQRWLRNIAVALGNAPYDQQIVDALIEKKQIFADDPLLIEHIDWAIKQQTSQLRRQSSVHRLNIRLIKSIEKGLPRDA